MGHALGVQFDVLEPFESILGVHVVIADPRATESRSVQALDDREALSCWCNMREFSMGSAVAISDKLNRAW